MSMYNMHTLQILTLGKHTRYTKKCSVTNKVYCVDITNEEQCRILIFEHPITDVLAHRTPEEINFISVHLTPSEFIKENLKMLN